LNWQVIRASALLRTSESMHRERALSAGQGKELRRLVREWAIPPYEIIRFGVHERPEAALDFVYDVETSAFHRLQNRRNPGAESDARLLEDKLAATRELERIGIPMAPLLHCVPRRSRVSLAQQIGPEAAVFCKMRRGRGGRLAFSSRRIGEALSGSTLIGAALTGVNVEEAWRALLEVDDALIQPLLRNHPALAPMAREGGLVTVRYISRRDGSCYCAILEVPLEADVEAGTAANALIPIDGSSGALLGWPSGPPHAPYAERLLSLARGRASSLERLPWWEEIRTFSDIAQRRVDGLWATAWDWAITPEGPLLLEGNAGWGLAVPQIVTGEPLALRLVHPAPATD
jgi:hypothetical protein